MKLDLIAFDADDTLWHNERLYEHSEAALAALLLPYGIEPQTLEESLLQTESRNIPYFGYGIKSFTLSMIETAVDLTGGGVSARDIAAIIDLARTQLRAPVELLEHVRETVSRLAKDHRLMVITKGDLQDQEDKMARSGLSEFFHDIEVVSDKTSEKYARLFKNHGLDPVHVLMVGNSYRSDILPVLQVGGHAAYVPYATTWLHEAAEAPAAGTARFYPLEHLGQLPALLNRLETAP